MLRVLILTGGLLGGAVASQFPAYSQQYVQRLGGAVDALSEVVADFDRSASAEGLTREAALAQLTGTAFLDRRQADMTRTFARHARLSADLATLQTAGPFMRIYHANRFTDRAVAQAALAEFEAALPLSAAGITFAAAGFFSGLAAMWTALRVLRRPFRSLRRA